MRSVSSQISRVSARSSSPTELSSNCAAPRMPDSGFLISCASIAPSAVTERAALRWVSCLSIFSAIDRSCSRSSHPVLGARQRRDEGVDQPAEAGARRRDVEPVAVDRRLGGDRVGDQVEHRRAERQNVDELARAAAPSGPMSKKCSAAMLTSTIAPEASIASNGCGRALSSCDGSSDARGGRLARSAPVHAASVCGCGAKARASRRSASSASSLVTSARRSASGAPAFSA